MSAPSIRYLISYDQPTYPILLPCLLSSRLLSTIIHNIHPVIYYNTYSAILSSTISYISISQLINISLLYSLSLIQYILSYVYTFLSMVRNNSSSLSSSIHNNHSNIISTTLYLQMIHSINIFLYELSYLNIFYYYHTQLDDLIFYIESNIILHSESIDNSFVSISNIMYCYLNEVLNASYR